LPGCNYRVSSKSYEKKFKFNRFRKENSKVCKDSLVNTTKVKKIKPERLVAFSVRPNERDAAEHRRDEVMRAPPALLITKNIVKTAISRLMALTWTNLSKSEFSTLEATMYAMHLPRSLPTNTA
jgi:hypothetical protein